MKPFLRWAGSKAQIIPSIRNFWNSEYKRYVEPFCGSACLFFSIQPKEALLSDLNEDLICTLLQIQTSVDVIVECLRRMRTDESSYYKIRAIDPLTLSPNERAARFIYLNTLCFNGLYRTNLQGMFNVPYGKKNRKNGFDPIVLSEASQVLSTAMIKSSDFETIVDRTREGDFLYLDPPYATQSLQIFTEYGKNIFSIKDLDRLMASIDRAVNRGVKFVLSYIDVPEIEKWKKQWSSIEVETRRNIAGFSGARKKTKELLISNCR